jgi:hypothetical protein
MKKLAAFTCINNVITGIYYILHVKLLLQMARGYKRWAALLEIKMCIVCVVE